jgi:O-antigen ligase
MHYSLGLMTMALAWLLPGHFYPYTAFQQDMLSVAGVVLLALAGMLSLPRSSSVQVPVPAWFACGLALLPVAQWCAGMVPFMSDAFLPAGYLAAFAIAVVAGTRLAQRPHFCTWLYGVLALAAAISVAIGVTQWLGLGPIAFIEPWTPGDRIVANLVQPNQLACLLALGVVAAVWFFERRLIGAITVAVLLVWLAVGLALTQSRAAWLMMIAIAGLWLWRRSAVGLRTTAAGLLTVFLVLGAVTLARAPLHSLWQTSGAAISGVELRTPPPLRLAQWETLWDALMFEPWFGYGWLQIAAAQQAAALDNVSTHELLSAAHNQVLDFLIWNGLPLGLVITGLIAWWFFDRARRCSNVDGCAGLAALAVLAAHSMVEFPLQYAYFLMPAGVLVGVIEARSTPRDGAIASAVMPRMALLGALLAMSAALYVIWDEYLEVDEAVRQVRLKNEARIVHKDLNPRAPDVTLLDAQREYVRLWTVEPVAGMAPEQIDWMRVVARRFAAPGALERYALAAGLNGRPDEALRALRLMCRMSLPRHCDRARAAWQQRAAVHPALLAVPYPATPSLLKADAQ